MAWPIESRAATIPYNESNLVTPSCHVILVKNQDCDISSLSNHFENAQPAMFYSTSIVGNLTHRARLS